MKQIIIIPSWYPTNKNRIGGSFFREQAVLFDQYKDDFFKDFTVQILLPVACEVSIFRYLFNKKVISIKAASGVELLTPPDGKVFNYFTIKKLKWVTNIVSLSNKWDASNLNILQQQLYLFIDKNYPKTEIKLVHAHSVCMGGIVAMFMSRYLDVPYIITEHQLINLNNYNPSQTTAIVQSFLNARYTFCVSGYLRQYLLATGMQSNYFVTGNYINEDLFKIMETNGRPLRGLAVIYDDYLKGPDTLFASLQILKHEYAIKDLRFSILSGMSKLSNGTDTLQLKAQQYGVMDICDFYYSAERQQMAAVFNNASFLISSSISETFGVAACEAICCGLPVVSTDCGGVRDFLDETNSIMVPVHDPVSLAGAIYKMAANYKLYDVENMRLNIIKKYGKGAFMHNLHSFYKQALS